MHNKLKTHLLSKINLPDSLMEETLELFTLKFLSRKEYFIEEGEKAKTFGFLATGIMRGFYRDEKGKEYNKTFFMAPDFVGAYSSLITDETNRINQQALTDCAILTANYKDFETLCDRHMHLQKLRCRIAEDHFVAKEEREISLVMEDAAARYRKLVKDIPQIEQLVAQHHIASFLGVSATQLSRIKKKIFNPLPM